MAEMKVVKVGERVRPFVLSDHNRKAVRLADLRGSKVLLSFHPLAWTGVCTEQMKALEKSRRTFAKLGVAVFGLSVDAVPSKAAWAKSMKLRETRLLSDFWPHGKVAKSLGIFRQAEGISERANIILDEKGQVIFAKVYPIGKLPDLEAILTFLKGYKKR